MLYFECENFSGQIFEKTIRENYTAYYEKQWIDAGGNLAVRHEGGAPSNNLIKDAPHRATVFVGLSLKSLFTNNRRGIHVVSRRFDSVIYYFSFSFERRCN